MPALARRACRVGLLRVTSLQGTCNQWLKSRQPGGAAVLQPESHLGRTALATCASAAPLQGATRTELVAKTDTISIKTSNARPDDAKQRLAEALDL